MGKSIKSNAIHGSDLRKLMSDYKAGEFTRTGRKHTALPWNALVKNCTDQSKNALDIMTVRGFVNQLEPNEQKQQVLNEGFVLNAYIPEHNSVIASLVEDIEPGQIGKAYVNGIIGQYVVENFENRFEKGYYKINAEGVVEYRHPGAIDPITEEREYEYTQDFCTVAFSNVEKLENGRFGAFCALSPVKHILNEAKREWTYAIEKVECVIQNIWGTAEQLEILKELKDSELPDPSDTLSVIIHKGWYSAGIRAEYNIETNNIYTIDQLRREVLLVYYKKFFLRSFSFS